MHKVKDKSREFEILIATMNRTSLDFLSAIFFNVNLHNYSVLIVNQTTEDHLLTSEFSNIRVVNSFEKGLSKSRNLALKNSIKEICLLADDDVVFKNGFDKHILEAHKEYSNPIITFQTETSQGNLYWNYPSSIKEHNDFITQKTLSIEISLKTSKLNNLNFDERFGLGAKFEDAENYIFLTEAKKRNIPILFVNETVGIHPEISSSDEVESDRLLYAKAAVNYYKQGKLAYIWVYKFVFFLFRKKHILYGEISEKLKVGFKGIQDFKKNNSNGK